MPRTKMAVGITHDLLDKINAHRAQLYRLPEYQRAPVPSIKASTFLTTTTTTTTTTKAKRATNRRSNTSSKSWYPVVADLSVFQHDEMAKNAAKALMETPWTEDMIRERLHNARSVSPEGDVGEMGIVSHIGAASDESAAMDIDFAATNSPSSHTISNSGSSQLISPSSEEQTQKIGFDARKLATSISRSSSGGKQSCIIRLKVSKPGLKKAISKRAKISSPRHFVTPLITAPQPAPSSRHPSSTARLTSSTALATPTSVNTTATAPALVPEHKRPTIRLRPMSYFDGLKNNEVNGGATPTQVTAN